MQATGHPNGDGMPQYCEMRPSLGGRGRSGVIPASGVAWDALAVVGGPCSWPHREPVSSRSTIAGNPDGENSAIPEVH